MRLFFVSVACRAGGDVCGVVTAMRWMDVVRAILGKWQVSSAIGIGCRGVWHEIEECAHRMDVTRADFGRFGGGGFKLHRGLM